MEDNHLMIAYKTKTNDNRAKFLEISKTVKRLTAKH